MNQYRFRYVDAYESVSGTVDAMDIAGAAISVLQECGTEPGRPRWRRYNIRENRVSAVPANVELVIFEGFEAGSYCLELIKVGTKKRKPLLLYA